MSAAMVPGYDPLAHFERRYSEQMDRFAQFALIAAREGYITEKQDAKEGPGCAGRK